MGNTRSDLVWSSTFEKIKTTHDLAYKAIDEAIKLEEQEKPHEAIEKYKEGILLIDRTLNIPVTCPQNQDFSWERAQVMIQKIKKTRGEVLTRINCIQSSPNFMPDSPPTYEEAVGNSYTYNDLAVALNELPVITSNHPAEVLYYHENVVLYFISPSGTVEKTHIPQKLTVYIVTDKENSVRIVYLQVGEWIYPLVPGVSPCYRTDYGAFIFPDVHSDVPGSSVGIVLPPDADESVYELLESILHGIVRQSVTTDEQPTFSGTISNGLVTGASFISYGLVTASQKFGDLLNYGTPKIIKNIKPAVQPAPIPGNVAKGFEIAKSTTSTAANVTCFVADKVGVATQALGRYLAPHIQKHGTRLLTTGFHLSQEDASSKVNGVLTVAAGAVEGFATVYKGLETSASILGQNVTNNTVKIVQHKYGNPAGEVTNNALNAVGNVVNISYNSKLFTPKGFIKSTAKETGKAIVGDIRNNMPSSNQVPTSNIYPSLMNLPSTSYNSHNKPEEKKELTENTEKKL